MATREEELQSRIDVLERFTLKHLSHLYGQVEPGKVPVTIDDMKSIYAKATEKPKLPAAPPDAKAEGMAGIYQHHSSPKAKKEKSNE